MHFWKNVKGDDVLNYEKRVCILYCVFVSAVLLLCVRLYNLSKPETNMSMQVLDGQYTGRIDVCERSGFIYDRKGRIISHRISGRIAIVNPAEAEDVLSLSEELSGFALYSSASEIYEKLVEGIPFTLAVSYSIEGNEPKGVYSFFLYGERNDIAKHFLGYNDTDGNGVTGLRKAYGNFLGNELYSRVSASFDTNAKRVSLSDFSLNAEKYLSDDGIVTTVDMELQEFCDGLGEEVKSGAVMVLDTKSGEILSLSSFPSYDTERLAEVLDSSKGELVNRVCRNFTPGSVFKMVVAAAALEKDASLFDYKYTCNGKTEKGDIFHCHNLNGHGEISMEEAFAQSCNTYFINLGSKIGIDAIIETAKKLGLDEIACADFLCEDENCFPDTEGKGEGYLANISFGQGDLCFSPMDMVRITSAAATGFLVPLSTVKGEIRDGVFVQSERAEKKRIFCENTCKKMKQMMKSCIENGTGRSAAVFGVNTGGKTATAQTGRFNENGVEYVHKWFCGVYPIENPRFAVCVLCDDVTEENVSPGAVFGKICSFLLEKDF